MALAVLLCVVSGTNGCKKLTDKSNGKPTFPPALDGGFELVANPIPGVNTSVPGVTVLGDCDGDGRVDIFRLTEGFVLPSRPTGMNATKRIPNGATAQVVDVDGDRIADLVLAGEEDIAIYRGHGDCTFEGTALSKAIPCPGGHVGSLHMQDANQDGLDDIVVTCAGIGEPPFSLLIARGDGSFDAQPVPPQPLGSTAPSEFPTFNAFLDDVDGDGLLDGFFLSDSSTGWFAWGASDDPVRFTRADDETNVISNSNPMSIQPLDFDRDGRMDYFLSGNGNNLLYRNLAPRELVDVGADIGLKTERNGDIFFQTWSACAADFDYDGWTDVLALRLQGNPDSPGGEQAARPYLYMNQHDGTFVDDAVHSANFLTQSYQMTCADMLGDGHVSCYVDGFKDTVLLQNHIELSHPWLGVRLQGTISGLTGTGARVSVDGQARPLIVVAGGQAGMETTHFLDVLLAANGSGSTDVTVDWPSGAVQHLSALPSLQYTVAVEPELFTVSRRVLPADGTSTVDVAINPALAGASTAGVEKDGPGSWVGAATTGMDGKVHRSLVAPGGPGATRLTISLNGKPLKVRPRIQFE